MSSVHPGNPPPGNPPPYSQPAPGTTGQPPQGYGMQPPPPGAQPLGTTMVVMSQPAPQAATPGGSTNYKHTSNRIQCQFCQAVVLTNVSSSPGILTWGICVLLCIFGCYLGCCLIPFCISSLQDTTHTCPNCGRVVGRGGPF